MPRIPSRNSPAVLTAAPTGMDPPGSDLRNSDPTAGQQSHPQTQREFHQAVAGSRHRRLRATLHAMVFKWLRGHLSLWPAAVVSGLIFGIFHLDPVMALSTWILGIAAAWAYERSESLWPAFAMHAVTNFVAQGLSYIFLWTGQR